MTQPIKHWTLMPGAEVIEQGDGKEATRAQFGVPPCVKLWFQKKLPPPTIFVLPDEFFRQGVVQVCLEFFVYYFLFVLGKAFGNLPPEEKLVVIGSKDQIKRAKRVLDVTLFGFAAEEMQNWQDEKHQLIQPHIIDMFRRMRAWFAPKKPGFKDLCDFIKSPTNNKNTLHPLVKSFFETHDKKEEALLLKAYEFAMLSLDDIIEWRSYDTQNKALLFAPDVFVKHSGKNQFQVEHKKNTLFVDLNFQENPAPYLLSLPALPAPVLPDVFSVVCMGSDSGFELEHPTTGFAFCINGSWAVVDAPVCASYLLTQLGIDPAEVQVILETHGHEDHMGSAIHFLLECLTTGRSYTYVAAEPVYRNCVAKVAAILGISEEDADQMLSKGSREKTPQAEAPAGGVIRIVPGVPIRLLGATWHFVWMIHPIPTTGFRIELSYREKTYSLAYSSDTAPASGFMGTDAMLKEGFLRKDEQPFSQLVYGNEDLVFWEAGGTYGDPIHFDSREWQALCESHGVKPNVVFMHTHPLPPALRNCGLARPGMVWHLIQTEAQPVSHVVKLSNALQLFKLSDMGYWLKLLLCQGQIRTYPPGTIILEKGEQAEDWYITLQGKAEAFIKEQLVCTFQSGAFFGELALLDDGRRKATVRAAGPVTLLQIPKDTFRDFVVANYLWNFFPNFWSQVDLLRQTRLFWGFPHEVVARLAKRSQKHGYKKGSFLLKEGTKGNELLVIVSGQVSVSKQNNKTKSDLMATRGPGEIVGEYSVLFPGSRHIISAKANTDVEALVLTGDVIDQILAGQLPLQLRLVSILAEQGVSTPMLESHIS